MSSIPLKPRSCVVIDDSEESICLLKEYISRSPFLTLLGTFKNPMEGLVFLQQNEADLLFIDIEMPGISGIELLKSLSKLPSVVMTTGHLEAAKDGFDLGITDFLYKPYTFERFLQAVNRCLSIHSITAPNTNGMIFLKVGKQIQKFNFSEILYVEAFGTYTKVYLADRWSLINESISQLSDKLPVNIFTRIHKSYLINLDKLNSYDSKNVWVGETSLPIGPMYQKNMAFLQGFAE